MLFLIGTSTFASIFLNYVNPVSIIDYLRRIRRHLSIYTAKTISMALISSRLHYYNDIAKIDLAKLQRVQNCLARVVLGAPRFSPPLLSPPLPLLRQRNGFLLLIELILSCPLLHAVLYLHNNHPTLLVSCNFHISLGKSDH